MADESNKTSSGAGGPEFPPTAVAEVREPKADRPAEVDVESEERRQLRPYRRLVGAVVAVVITVACAIILQGIIRHLDRMPSASSLAKPKTVDDRALRACAEDLERLEGRVRQAAGKLLSSNPAEDETPVDWESASHDFEVERVRIVARCRLNEKSSDAAVADLETAASEVEALIRGYSLLYSRYLEGGLPHARTVRDSVRRAVAALSNR